MAQPVPSPHTPQVLKLLVLLCQLPVHISLYLVQLQLDAQRLALLMLQGSLETIAAMRRWPREGISPATHPSLALPPSPELWGAGQVEPPQCLAVVAQPA